MLFNQKWDAKQKQETIKLYAGGLNFVPAETQKKFVPVKSVTTWFDDPSIPHHLHYPVAPNPTADSDWRKCLADAADLIERRGWTQGRNEDVTGICAGHAITMTARGSAMVAGHAMHMVSRFVGGQAIPAWNDSSVRSKYEVIGTLRCVAEFG